MKKLDIVYEDREILVVNKPAKLLTIATDKVKDHTLYHEVREYIHKKNQKVFIVHRLDKDTSGIVLFAKNEALKEQLQNGWNAYKRGYVAVVCGHMPKKEDTLRLKLKENKEHHVYVSEDGTGLNAVTSYKVLSENSSQSLVDVRIKTGRRNQIRASFAYIGNPIVGDKKYEASINSLSRLGLHASYLEIEHPVTHKKMVFESKVPKVFYLGFKEFNK